MLTHSFEFIFGVICLGIGMLNLLLRRFLGTRRREALRRADRTLAEEGFSGITVLGTLLISGVIALIIGCVLVTVSIIAYENF